MEHNPLYSIHNIHHKYTHTQTQTHNSAELCGDAGSFARAQRVHTSRSASVLCSIVYVRIHVYSVCYVVPSMRIEFKDLSQRDLSPCTNVVVLHAAKLNTSNIYFAAVFAFARSYATRQQRCRGLTAYIELVVRMVHTVRCCCCCCVRPSNKTTQQEIIRIRMRPCAMQHAHHTAYTAYTQTHRHRHERRMFFDLCSYVMLDHWNAARVRREVSVPCVLSIADVALRTICSSSNSITNNMTFVYFAQPTISVLSRYYTIHVSDIHFVLRCIYSMLCVVCVWSGYAILRRIVCGATLRCICAYVCCIFVHNRARVYKRTCAREYGACPRRDQVYGLLPNYAPFVAKANP